MHHQLRGGGLRCWQRIEDGVTHVNAARVRSVLHFGRFELRSPAPVPDEGRPTVRVDLVAVQAAIRPEHYRTAAAFRRRVLELTAAAVTGLPDGAPRVIAFPEAFAVPLLFWLETPDAVVRQRSAMAAALSLLRSQWREVLRSAVMRRSASPALFYHVRAPVVWPVYEEAFRAAARASGAYLVAGSLFTPAMDWEPMQGFHPSGHAALNLGLVLSPRGAILARVAKRRLTPDETRSFLTASPAAAPAIETAIGRISVLICLDAFHESLVEEADASGAWLLVQPSANNAAWEGPWTGDPAQVEGEAWLREGLAKKLEDREHLRYGINAMLNGSLYDVVFEGRSSVAAAGSYLALAEHHAGDAVVRASVKLEPQVTASAPTPFLLPLGSRS
jgi:predicted amidohydrolase